MKTLPGNQRYMELNMKYFYASGLRRANAEWNWFTKIAYYIWRLLNVFNLYLITSLLLLYIFKVEDRSIERVALPIISMCLYGCMAVRFVYFLIYADEGEFIVDQMNETFMSETRFAFEPQTMYDTAKFADKFLKGWIVFVCVCGTFYAIPALIKNDRELPVSIWTPFDNSQTPYYQLLFIYELFTQNMMVLAFAHVDVYFVNTSLLTARQYQLLAIDFENIFNYALSQCGYTRTEIEEFDATRLTGNHNSEALHARVAETALTPKFEDIIRRSFHICISQHQKILEFTKLLQEFLGMQLLILTLFNFGYLSFTVFSFLMIDDPVALYALAQYILGMSVQMWLMTFSGKDIAYNADNLRESAWGLPWYLCSKELMHELRFVLVRMTPTVAIKAGNVIPMTLETYLEYMKRIYSVTAILRQMIKK